jgi:hypothetical protein
MDLGGRNLTLTCLSIVENTDDIFGESATVSDVLPRVPFECAYSGDDQCRYVDSPPAKTGRTIARGALGGKPIHAPHFVSAASRRD